MLKFIKKDIIVYGIEGFRQVYEYPQSTASIVHGFRDFINDFN